MTEAAPFLERANLLLAQGRPKDAERQLAEALRIEPENDYALGLLARCKFDQRQFREGIEVIKRAITVMPDEGYYFYLMAFGHYQLDQNPPALKYLQRAVELSPWTAEFFGLWALVLLDEKDFEQALERANEGLAVDAENITCLNVRATALNKLKRVDDAIETMQDALEKDPENAYTHTTVGWNLLEKGRHKDAAKHFREALRLQPNLDGAREGLKQALKSKIPPYKWLLQYSFWINNKGKNARWAIPLGIYLGVQVIGRLSEKGGDNLAAVGLAVGGLYILFVITSWVINPLANFFLLFHKDGKYALSSREKANALALIGALLTGLSLVIVGFFMPGSPEHVILAGFVAMSLGLPLGHMNFPLRVKGNSPVQWFAMALVVFGLVTIGFALTGTAIGSTILMIYLVGFVLYTWASIFGR
ncbi:tetratricopeptide repeat protein [Paraflavitalea sp. CAU 1676]|uniref:tetratricopeptide repeat protein n=1 Tax=Paraflavitalea sp. CAU 1676 TaxID=3032598 RepID=UPI0023D9987D|nr:tetratricopeptide repeat protein [Paraflavitalea sp. CAU 1676]MDF2187840.1 tetratricopeptide repeat protein [Paraflavitalea sp. CAU 1676]